MAKAKKAFARAVATSTGLNVDQDWKALRKRSREQQYKRVTSTSFPGLRNIRGGTFPGSLCYNFRPVDYTSHIIVPALMADKYPKGAVKVARVSPRWGATVKHKREDRVIAPPWAAGQLRLERVSNTESAIYKHDKKLGKLVVRPNKIDLRLQNQYKNKGYGVEALYLLRKQRPDLGPSISKHRAMIEKPWNRAVPLTNQELLAQRTHTPYYYRTQGGKRIMVRKGRRK